MAVEDSDSATIPSGRTSGDQGNTLEEEKCHNVHKKTENPMGLRSGFMLKNISAKIPEDLGFQPTEQSPNSYERMQTDKLGPETSRSNKPKKRANFDEVFVNVPTTVVSSLSSVLKAKRTARKKTVKKFLTPNYSLQLQELLEKIENDSDFVGSLSDIDEVLRS